jgi:nucleoside-diphosphate-sugar epimerase
MGTVVVTGANGMLGKTVSAKFKSQGVEVIEVTRQKVDLMDANKTFDYLSKYDIDLIIHCAAVVGGIQANINGGTKFFTDNVRIDSSVLFASKALGVENLIYIGSSCMYPANIDHPLKENEILTGLVEPTNENYALAKIFGARLTTSIAIENNLNWRVFIASNLYGPYDHFGTDKSHLLGAVIKKSIEAKEKRDLKIDMWGDGSPKREFTYVTDFADWIFNSSKILNKLPHVLNTGIGEDYSVIEYYNKVLNTIGYSCEVVANKSKANGNMRKLMDSSLAMKFGWSPKVSIDEGIKKTIDWYLLNKAEI